MRVFKYEDLKFLKSQNIKLPEYYFIHTKTELTQDKCEICKTKNAHFHLSVGSPKVEIDKSEIIICPECFAAVGVDESLDKNISALIWGKTFKKFHEKIEPILQFEKDWNVFVGSPMKKEPSKENKLFTEPLEETLDFSIIDIDLSETEDSGNELEYNMLPLEQDTRYGDTQFKRNSATFIKNLKTIKDHEGWKCKWLDRKIGTSNAVSAWLRGETRIRTNNMKKAALALGFSYEDMISPMFNYYKCRNKEIYDIVDPELKQFMKAKTKRQAERKEQYFNDKSVVTINTANFVANLDKVMKNRGLSCADLDRMIGASDTTQKWFTDNIKYKNRPSYQSMIKVCEALKINYHKMITYEAYPDIL